MTYLDVLKHTSFPEQISKSTYDIMYIMTDYWPLLAPAVTVGETEGAMIPPPFFLPLLLPITL